MRCLGLATGWRAALTTASHVFAHSHHHYGCPRSRSSSKSTQGHFYPTWRQKSVARCVATDVRTGEANECSCFGPRREYCKTLQRYVFVARKWTARRQRARAESTCSDKESAVPRRSQQTIT